MYCIALYTCPLSLQGNNNASSTSASSVTSRWSLGCEEEKQGVGVVEVLAAGRREQQCQQIDIDTEIAFVRCFSARSTTSGGRSCKKTVWCGLYPEYHRQCRPIHIAFCLACIEGLQPISDLDVRLQSTDAR